MISWIRVDFLYLLLVMAFCVDSRDFTQVVHVLIKIMTA